MECKECRTQVNFEEAQYKSCMWLLESGATRELKCLMFSMETTTNTRVRIQVHVTGKLNSQGLWNIQAKE